MNNKLIIPSYLRGYEELYKQNPRKANLEWFKGAKYGLFMHYGVYSILKSAAWVQHRKKSMLKNMRNLRSSLLLKNLMQTI